MADLYDIVKVPNAVLKQEAQVVERVTPHIQAQMDRMLATMYDAPGIGLAANQVGLLNRVLVMDISRKDEDEKGDPILHDQSENYP